MVNQEPASAAERRGRPGWRAAFYAGDIAETIVRYHERNGGRLAKDDLADLHSRYEEPVKVRWRDWEVYTCGRVPGGHAPAGPAHGRGIGRAGRPHNSADYEHLVTEILKAACADREYRYGDHGSSMLAWTSCCPTGTCREQARVSAIDHVRHAPPIGRYPSNAPPPAASRRRCAATRSGARHVLLLRS
jgi:gamma-glutamyltranspeptidase/glutathione hydrolase